MSRRGGRASRNVHQLRLVSTVCCNPIHQKVRICAYQHFTKYDRLSKNTSRTIQTSHRARTAQLLLVLPFLQLDSREGVRQLSVRWGGIRAFALGGGRAQRSGLVVAGRLALRLAARGLFFAVLLAVFALQVDDGHVSDLNMSVMIHMSMPPPCCRHCQTLGPGRCTSSRKCGSP